MNKKIKFFLFVETNFYYFYGVLDKIKNEERRNIELLNPLTNKIRRPIVSYAEHMQYNRDFAKKQHQTIFVCECGITTSETHKRRHQKTNLHLTKLKATKENSPA